MSEQLLAAYVWQASMRWAWHGWASRRIREDDRGEGVISAAIAVLVMAFLGVLMWQLFGDTLRKANTNVNNRLDQMK
ncbi:MAG TPA: hypothetical protein VGO92_05825 [Acidimicrobiales bacterium]|jgi:hypothetical protein|nr:hypothetical protein [Acidimicrobiales bacterium]